MDWKTDHTITHSRRRRASYMNEEPDEISESIVFGNGDFTRLMQARCDELQLDKKTPGSQWTFRRIKCSGDGFLGSIVRW